MTNYDELDPGIRDLVRRLNDAGFVTTDSGDGVSKPADWYQPNEHGITEAMPFPNVAVSATPETMQSIAKRLAKFLGRDWNIEATYWPHDRTASVLATQMSSARPRTGPADVSSGPQAEPSCVAERQQMHRDAEAQYVAAQQSTHASLVQEMEVGRDHWRDECLKESVQNDNLRQAIARLMRFRYESLGYGRLRCRSCGALASEDFGEDRRTFKAEACSPVCPWEVAAALLRRSSAPVTHEQET